MDPHISPYNYWFVRSHQIMFRTIWAFKTKELVMNNCFSIQRYRALNIIILFILIFISSFSSLSLPSRRKLVAYLDSSLNFPVKNVYFYQCMMPISKVKTLLAFVSICVCNAQCKLEIIIVLHGTWSVLTCAVGTSTPDLTHWIENISRSINGIRQRSDYITLVTGPNKSYRNSHGLLRQLAHNIRGKVWMKTNIGLHGFTDNNLLSVKPCMLLLLFFPSNFAVYIVCRCNKPCEFLGFVWIRYWGIM